MVLLLIGRWLIIHIDDVLDSNYIMRDKLCTCHLYKLFLPLKMWLSFKHTSTVLVVKYFTIIVQSYCEIYLLYIITLCYKFWICWISRSLRIDFLWYHVLIKVPYILDLAKKDAKWIFFVCLGRSLSAILLQPEYVIIPCCNFLSIGNILLIYKLSLFDICHKSLHTIIMYNNI